MEFGEVVKKLRKGKKLTSSELAKKSGISQAYLSQLETGKNKNPTNNIIRKLSKGLDIPYIELMQRTGYVEREGAVPTYSLHEAFGIKPSEQERLKDNKLGSKGSEINIFKINLDYALKDEAISIYYKGRLMTKEEKENVNQLIDIHLKGR